MEELLLLLLPTTNTTYIYVVMIRRRGTPHYNTLGLDEDIPFFFLNFDQRGRDTNFIFNVFSKNKSAPHAPFYSFFLVVGWCRPWRRGEGSKKGYA